MQKHRIFEHFFKFLNQIRPKGTLIVTLQSVSFHDEDPQDYAYYQPVQWLRFEQMSGVTKVLKGRFIHSAFKPQLKIQF